MKRTLITSTKDSREYLFNGKKVIFIREEREQSLCPSSIPIKSTIIGLNYDNNKYINSVRVKGFGDSLFILGIDALFKWLEEKLLTDARSDQSNE